MRWASVVAWSSLFAFGCTPFGSDTAPSPDGGPQVTGSSPNFGLTISVAPEPRVVAQAGKVKVKVNIEPSKSLRDAKLPIHLSTSSTARLSSSQVDVLSDQDVAEIEIGAADDAEQGDSKFDVIARFDDGERRASGSVFVRGRAGRPDTLFGKAGVVDDAFPTYAWPTSVLVQPDDKILVVAACENAACLVRLQPNGAIDSTFGQGGRFTAPLSSTGPLRAALQPDGKILLAARKFDTSDRILLFRLTSTGALDSSFGSGGVGTWMLPQGLDTTVGHLATLPTGESVVGFTWYRSDSRYWWGVIKLDSSGQPSGPPAYGGWSTGSSFLHWVTLRSNGAIAGVGTANSPDSVGIFQLTPARAYDTNFGNGTGYFAKEVNAPPPRQGEYLPQRLGGVQKNGQLILASIRQGGGSALTRFAANGSGIDTTFGTAGSALGIGQPVDILLDGDDRIYLLATEPAGPWHLSRFGAGGVLDGTFGSGGAATIDSPSHMSGEHLNAQAIALQSDGRIIVAGFIAANETNNWRVWVKRVWN